MRKAEDGSYALDYDLPQSIGHIGPFYGSFAVVLKALAYMMRLGAEGLTRAAEFASLNANYLRKKLEEDPANPRLIRTVWGKGYQID